MKVALRDIKPNPFRYINKGYPIDKVKVEKLRSSIKRTGFWDNLVARKNFNGQIEIAYGHHRIEACRQEFDPSHEIDVILRDLTDADMLKIMAAENDAMDVMSPLVINETVKATRDFLRDNPDELNKISLIKKGRIKANGHHSTNESMMIAGFLDWSISRVEESFATFQAMEQGDIDKDEYEGMPNQSAAAKYRKEIKKNPLPKEARLGVVEQIKTGQIGVRHIRQEIMKAKFPGTPEKKHVYLDDVADKVSKNLKDSALLMSNKFIENADGLSEGAIDNLAISVKMLYARLNKLKIELGDGKLKLMGE